MSVVYVSLDQFAQPLAKNYHHSQIFPVNVYDGDPRLCVAIEQSPLYWGSATILLRGKGAHDGTEGSSSSTFVVKKYPKETTTPISNPEGHVQEDNWLPLPAHHAILAHDYARTLHWHHGYLVP